MSRPTHHNPQRFAGRQWLCFAAMIAVGLVAAGCVRRRLAVVSNPPGATVFVDNQRIGTTPCSVDFTYYGTREIRLVKAGFETLTVNQPIPAPWYEITPIDFFSENLVPTKIEDHRTVSYNLQPQVIVPTEQLLDRANQLREHSQQGAVVPATATGVPNAAGPATTPLPEIFSPPEGDSAAPVPLPPTSAPGGDLQPYYPPVPQSPAAAPPVLPDASPPRGQPIVSPPPR